MDNMTEKETNNILIPKNPSQLSVDGCVVRLNFSSKTEKHVLEDVKHIILNGLTRVKK